jgi:predicted dehydrogenase
MNRPGGEGRIRVGIIGAGIAGERHAVAFAARPDAAVAAVADTDPSRGRALAARFGAAYYADYREALAHGIDAAIVCLPHALHAECATDAARAKVHLLLEKPIANTLDDARRIIDAADAADIRLMIGYVHRFRDEVATAHELILEGRLGRPATALDRFISGGMQDTPAWVWDRDAAGGGVVMYGGVHAIDRLRWLLGDEVVEVYARASTYSNPTDVEDGMAAILTFASGATAVLYENAPGYGRLGTWTTEVFGSEGAVIVTTGAGVEYRDAQGSRRWTFGEHRHFERQAEEFVTAIREHRPPSVDGTDGLRGLEIALALYRSAALGRPVPV